MKNKEIKILLSAPRGFCAGVERAIEIVEKSIQKYGAPVYVRHEIVHNKYVVDDLKNKGAIFVEELEEIEDKSRPVIFSAHGVPKKIPDDAKLLPYSSSVSGPIIEVPNVDAFKKNGIDKVSKKFQAELTDLQKKIQSL